MAEGSALRGRHGVGITSNLPRLRKSSSGDPNHQEWLVVTEPVLTAEAHARYAAGMASGTVATDATIRGALREDLETANPGADQLVVDELGLCHGSARIDLALINGAIHGYEIKGERDTLHRLPEQQVIYSLVLDTVTLVTAAKHARNVADVVPEWWGITEAQPNCVGGLQFNSTRPAAPNPAPDAAAIAQLLWRAEALAALTELGCAPGLRSRSKRMLCEALVEAVTQEELGGLVRNCLRSRRAWPAPSPPTSDDGLFQPGAKSWRSRVRVHRGRTRQ